MYDSRKLTSLLAEVMTDLDAYEPVVVESNFVYERIVTKYTSKNVDALQVHLKRLIEIMDDVTIHSVDTTPCVVVDQYNLIE